MFVTVVQVRVVRVPVGELLMRMGMRMGFAPRVLRAMSVLVVLVMSMQVLVEGGFMSVKMRVPFS